MKDVLALANEAFLVSFAHMGKVLVFSVESLTAEITDRVDIALYLLPASLISGC